MLSFLLLIVLHVQAGTDEVIPSATLPSEGMPEHQYTLFCGNNWYANPYTAPTLQAAKAATFAFYAVTDKADTYRIYNVSAGKWMGYTLRDTYPVGTNFVQQSTTQPLQQYWKLSKATVAGNTYYQFSPYTSGGTVASLYLNWYGGTSQNKLDGETVTLGLWSQGASADAGSRWEVKEVKQYIYTVQMDEGVSVTVNGKAVQQGQTCSSIGQLTHQQVIATASTGKFAVVRIDNTAMTLHVKAYEAPALRTSLPYTQAVLYPMQQTAVGVAQSETNDNAYTLYNNVLAATYLKIDNALYFAGSHAMNLMAGTEPFTVSFGDGDRVSASAMTLKSCEMKAIPALPNAVGGAEHYAGQALEAHYEYTYKGEKIEITWRAVLRDGSHYLRTEMELHGVGNVDMYDVIPLMYALDTKAAGSVPQVVGNTRGAVLLNDKIFAGLETPMGYNTVGEGVGEEDKWTLTTQGTTRTLAVSDWTQVPAQDVPARVEEAIGKNYPHIYGYTLPNLTLTQNQKVVVTLRYKTGNNRFNLGGCDLIDASGSVAANDYHAGYAGTKNEKNTFTFIVPNDGTYSIRLLVENASEPLSSTGEMVVQVYEPKAGVVVDTEVVNLQGRWSRNTTLQAGETWKVSSVIGLIAQDGQQHNPSLRKTQKRRSFLAYSERERAVPWRCNPAYISWYELNINRNNAQPGQEHTNMQASSVLDVMQQWKTKLYDKYGVAPNSFVIDDGWDNYGPWTFHKGFPHEMRDMATLANQMGAGVGAWLGPVGGYGRSGDYRRDYWKTRGGMVLGNPAYYAVFKAAAQNLVENQGDLTEGGKSFQFFKFDGISAQFSATGPDNGDAGNENAEGIIRLERYVREELKRDIFFNTSVGTWASPFWYRYTDATWRQENDYSTIGNNPIDRENWITYRDRLVYQNYVTNSPICPINTLMTHGFILSTFGNVSKDFSYQSCLNELRCAFACGSGMVELYNDYALTNSIENGKLWGDIADCIKWQRENADVLMDSHWVGGNPWNGSKADIYGWAAWNGKKSVLTLRNGASTRQTITLTLREALEIPANVTGSIVLTKSFADQKALTGLTEGQPIDIDTPLTLSLPASSVYIFGGKEASEETAVTAPYAATASRPHTVYNLRGQQLLSPQRGVNIIDGKKIVLR